MDMRKWWPLSVLAAALVCGAARADAQGDGQDRGFWSPASNDAVSITDAITIGKDKITIDLLTYPLAPIRKLKPVEVSAVFDADVRAGIEGSLYRLRVPAGQRFEHKNTLCGGEDTQWMATYVTGKNLRVAFFSGDDMPVFSFDAIQSSPALCGTFVYAR